MIHAQAFSRGTVVLSGADRAVAKDDESPLSPPTSCPKQPSRDRKSRPLVVGDVGELLSHLTEENVASRVWTKYQGGHAEMAATCAGLERAGGFDHDGWGGGT